MTTEMRDRVLVLAVAAVVLFANLGSARLWDRDEPRNAGCAAEMLARHDWVTPVFNDQLRVAKPVLLYWLVMSAYALFGVNEFAARFWSATLGLGTILATYHLGHRLLGRRAGLWGALALGSMLMFDVAARACTPDAVLIFFTTAALAVFVHGAFRPDGTPRGFPEEWPTIVLLYGLLGCAVLAKGPVGLVLPVAVMGLYLLIHRRSTATETEPSTGRRGSVAWFLRLFAPRHFLSTCWAMRPITALLVACAVAGPWYVWVGLRTDGEWPARFFLYENVQRAMQPLENHRGGPWFYPVALLVGSFPWSVLAAPVVLFAVTTLRRGERDAPALALLASWIGVYVGLFSLASTKLPSYITPCYPAWALLIGTFLARWTAGEWQLHPWWPRAAAGVLAIVGVGWLIVVPLVTRRYLPGEAWLAAIGLIPLLGGAAWLVLVERRGPRAAAPVFALLSTGFATALFGVVTVRVDRHQQSHVILAAIDSHSRTPEVGAFGCLEPSWVFYGRRAIREWPGDRDGAVRFVSESPERFLLTTDRALAHLREHLPPQVGVLERTPYFLKKDQLLLLGWTPESARLARETPPTRR